MTKKDFSLRLAKLRTEKGVSAQNMSLSIGQNHAYINRIENGKALPSMTTFFYICKYLNITPSDFFDTETANPAKAIEICNMVKDLSDDQLDNLITLIKGLHK